MKRILSVIIVLALLITGGSAAFSENSFTDVPQDAWYAKYVDVCVKEGLLQGVGNGRFAPDATLSRAEMFTVCARLHSKLHGGDGNIPRLPAEGPRGLVYFTDTEGKKVASFDDTLGGREEFGDEDGYNLVVFFDEEVMARLRGGDEPLDKLLMVSLISGEERFAGAYFAEDDCYTFFVPFDYPVDLFDELGYIFNYSGGDYAGKWYESTMWYWDKVFASSVASEYEEALYELYVLSEEHAREDAANEEADLEALDQDDTGLDESGLDDTGLDDLSLEYPILAEPSLDDSCPRFLLAAYIAYSLPYGYLDETEDLPKIPDMDAELIRILYGAGIFTGVDEEGNFDGFGTLTRAQMAAVIARVIDKEEFRI